MRPRSAREELRFEIRPLSSPNGVPLFARFRCVLLAVLLSRFLVFSENLPFCVFIRQPNLSIANTALSLREKDGVRNRKRVSQG